MTAVKRSGAMKSLCIWSLRGWIFKIIFWYFELKSKMKAVERRFFYYFCKSQKGSYNGSDRCCSPMLSWLSIMPCFSWFAILLQDPERWNFRCQKDVISVIWWWGEERISERLLENDSLCYLSPDFTADSYQEERDLTVHQPEEKICESDFPPPLSPPQSFCSHLSKKKKNEKGSSCCHCHRTNINFSGT